MVKDGEDSHGLQNDDIENSFPITVDSVVDWAPWTNQDWGQIPVNNGKKRGKTSTHLAKWRQTSWNLLQGRENMHSPVAKRGPSHVSQMTLFGQNDNIARFDWLSLVHTCDITT